MPVRQFLFIFLINNMEKNKIEVLIILNKTKIHGSLADGAQAEMSPSFPICIRVRIIGYSWPLSGLGLSPPIHIRGFFSFPFLHCRGSLEHPWCHQRTLRPDLTLYFSAGTAFPWANYL